MNKGKRFHVLDAFRGIAACMLVLYHITYKSNITENTFVTGSNVLVDYFFVLSGFIIAYNYSRVLNTFRDVKKFLFKRFKRIYPLHFYALIVIFSVELLKIIPYNMGIINFPPFQEANNLRTFLSSLFILNSTGIVHGIGWNFPSWSISAEFISYVVFSLITLLFIRNGYLSILIPIIALIALFLVNKNLNIISTGDFGYIRCLYGFYIGVATYFIYNKYHVMIDGTTKRFLYTFLEFLVLLVIIVLVMIKKELIEISFIYPLVFAVSVFIFSFELGYLSHFFKINAFRYLGNVSYSIYMNHVLVIFIFEFALIKVLKISNPSILDIGALLILLSVIFYSHFTHKYIELRFYRSIKR